MNSLTYIDTIIHKNEFINHLYEICKPYDNQYISCTMIGKYLRRNKFIVKKIYNKIMQLIYDKDITFLMPCTIYKDTFYINTTGSLQENAQLDYAAELDIIYLLYEYIIVNGINEPVKKDFPYIYIWSDKLGDFYKKYEHVKQIIKSNGGIIIFIKKYANDIILIEKNTNTSFILYIEN